MTFNRMQQRAMEVRRSYDQLHAARGAEPWTRTDYAVGMVGDMGDLVKLLQRDDGKRTGTADQAAIEHEVSDLLWSVIILANDSGIDLETAFWRTMDEIDNAIESEMIGVEIAEHTGREDHV